MAKIKSKDNYWARKVKERDKYRCQIGLRNCVGSPVESMHIVNRTRLELRHDLDNGISGCKPCHFDQGNEKINFIGLLERIIPEQFKRLSEKHFRIYGIRLRGD